MSHVDCSHVCGKLHHYQVLAFLFILCQASFPPTPLFPLIYLSFLKQYKANNKRNSWQVILGPKGKCYEIKYQARCFIFRFQRDVKIVSIPPYLFIYTVLLVHFLKYYKLMMTFDFFLTQNLGSNSKYEGHSSFCFSHVFVFLFL